MILLCLSFESEDKMERQLPEWMTKTNTVKQTSEAPKSPSVPESVTGSVCDRRLAYLMSPRELQMMAKQILGHQQVSNASGVSHS